MMCQFSVSNFHDKYVVCKKKSIWQYTEYAVFKNLGYLYKYLASAYK